MERVIIMSLLGEYEKILQKFYKDLDNVNFDTISNEKLDELKEKSIYINHLYHVKSYGESKSNRYIKILEKILCNCRKEAAVNTKFTTSTNEEKLLLFLLSVDPELEAAITFGSFNKIIEIKYEFEKKFGIYDIGLVKLEKIYIKKFLTEEKQNEIKEEIEKRSFK